MDNTLPFYFSQFYCQNRVLNFSVHVSTPFAIIDPICFSVLALATHTTCLPLYLSLIYKSCLYVMEISLLTSYVYWYYFPQFYHLSFFIIQNFTF